MPQNPDRPAPPSRCSCLPRPPLEHLVELAREAARNETLDKVRRAHELRFASAAAELEPTPSFLPTTTIVRPRATSSLASIVAASLASLAIGVGITIGVDFAGGRTSSAAHGAASEPPQTVARTSPERHTPEQSAMPTPTHASIDARPQSTMAPPATLPAFNRDAARAALVAARARAAACGDGSWTGWLQVAVTFAPSGRVTTAFLDAKSALRGTDVGVCIARHMRTARVPTFDGTDVVVQTTVRLLAPADG